LRLRFFAWLVPGLLMLYAAQQLPLPQYTNLWLAPVMDALYTPVRWFDISRLWLQDRARLQARLSNLQTRLEQQAAFVQETRSLREENRQLRRLLYLPEISGMRWQAARLLARSPERLSRHLTIETIGATPDSVVASGDGLVGLVDTVRGNHAVVRTIMDASLAVPVTISRLPLAALLRGLGDRLQVDFVPWKSAPPVGSILQTSGAGGIYPPGIPVARITLVRRVAGEAFAAVEAAPLAHWHREAWLAVLTRKTP